MNHDPNFPGFGQQSPQQYGLHSYDMPPARRSLLTKLFGEGGAQRFSSPLFSTAAFVIAGVALAGLIFAVYPDSESQGDIPVVKAETLAYKEIPAEPGGMFIPNRDSTVFSAMGEGMDESAPIEDLLAEEEPLDKLAAFARQVEESMEEEQASSTEAGEEVIEDLSTLAAAEAEAAPVTLQKIARPVEDEKRPKIIHKPGENPETLDFVRSVLDKKDSAQETQRIAATQPAAGNAGRQIAVTPGAYYVQLGSVKSPDGAESEWGRLVKEFDAELGSVSHRVQAAELGDRGTFYRIQAGPMSKASAGEICDSIKARKPGGCLVTQ